MGKILGVVLIAVWFCGCGSTSGGGPRYEMWVNDGLLAVTEVTFIKARCVGRLIIKSKETADRTLLLSFAEQVADSIPADGSFPVTDDELKTLIPTPPLTGDFSGFEEDLTDTVTGPWLETKDAFSWINGGGSPLDDAGFEAVAGEFYIRTTDSLELSLALVNMSSSEAASVGFDNIHWNTGTQYE